MRSRDIITDGFDRVRGVVHDVVDGCSREQLTFRADPEANTIAWLVWHLTRVQDDHICEIAGVEQAWTADGWADRFDLRLERSATGYGHSNDEVAAVAADSRLLLQYFDAVHARTVQYLSTVTDDGLDRVVDERWDPPVTLGVRLVSVIADDLQHAGQAAFVKGVVRRTR